MPSSPSILANLTEVANQAQALAIAWHIVIAIAVVAVVRGLRPSERATGWALVTPLISVSALAFIFDNPFNGALFAALAFVSALFARRLSRKPAALGPAWARAVGVALIAFSWFYPHFLASGTPQSYLLAAPTGLIPCPTLALVIGVTLLANGLGSRAWCRIVGGAGAFYGVVGVLGLGVWLDVALVAGAVALLASSFGQQLAPARTMRLLQGGLRTPMRGRAPRSGSMS